MGPTRRLGTCQAPRPAPSSLSRTRPSLTSQGPTKRILAFSIVIHSDVVDTNPPEPARQNTARL
ncbi:hypothetical protein P7K49_004151, partial [Saguinus oedipus]